jgi:cyclophilin family peptidyl-prolyl cis-trans isomerase
MTVKRRQARAITSRHVSRRAAEEREALRAERRRDRVRALQAAGAVIVLGILVIVALSLLRHQTSPVSTADTLAPTDTSTADASATSSAASSTTATTRPLLTPTVTSCDQAVSTVGGKPVFPTAPVMMIDPAKTYTATISTTTGTITAQLSPTIAPVAVNNFVFLARCGVYDNTVVDAAVGDEFIAGTITDGVPGYAIPDELPAGGGYPPGSIAMYNQGPNTAGSAFFVVAGDSGTSLPTSYTLFGRVTAGLDVARGIAGAGAAAGGAPTAAVTITSVTIAES